MMSSLMFPLSLVTEIKLGQARSFPHQFSQWAFDVSLGGQQAFRQPVIDAKLLLDSKQTEQEQRLQHTQTTNFWKHIHAARLYSRVYRRPLVIADYYAFISYYTSCHDHAAVQQLAVILVVELASSGHSSRGSHIMSKIHCPCCTCGLSLVCHLRAASSIRGLHASYSL